ncbi:MAG: HEAT repeat domain-containing protein [Asgard group archaeon]|nr:HEAT repeat domain-containing protein [Asgard group archaeon]
MPKEEEVIPEEEIIKELIKTLNDKNAQSDIIYALARIGEPALPYIRELFQEKSIASKLLAVKIFGRIGKPTLLDLIKATEDKDSTVRYEAVRYLGRLDLNGIDAIDDLRKLLKDECQEVQEKAQWAIRRIKRSYQEYQITIVLSDAYNKYLTKKMTFTEMADLIATYKRKGKYLLDKIFDFGDEAHGKLYLSLYDYLVKKKIFTLDDDVLNIIRKQKVKINFRKRYAREHGYFSLHPTRIHINYQKSSHFLKCLELIKKTNVTELLTFYSQEVDEEPHKNTIIFLEIFAFLDRNNYFDELLQFFDENYYLYDSDYKLIQREQIIKYLQIQKDILLLK